MRLFFVCISDSLFSKIAKDFVTETAEIQGGKIKDRVCKS